MIRRQPISTRTVTLFPYTTRFRSKLPLGVRLWQLRAQRRARSEVVDIWRRAAMVGGALLLGFVALAFAKAGDEAQKLLFHISHRAWWLPILVTPAGFAFVVWAANRFSPAPRGSGIPQIIPAAHPPATERHHHPVPQPTPFL